MKMACLLNLIQVCGCSLTDKEQGSRYKETGHKIASSSQPKAHSSQLKEFHSYLLHIQ